MKLAITLTSLAGLPVSAFVLVKVWDWFGLNMLLSMTMERAVAVFILYSLLTYRAVSPTPEKKDIDLMVECIMNSFVQPFIVLVLAWLVARLFF